MILFPKIKFMVFWIVAYGYKWPSISRFLPSLKESSKLVFHTITLLIRTLTRLIIKVRFLKDIISMRRFFLPRRCFFKVKPWECTAFICLILSLWFRIRNIRPKAKCWALLFFRFRGLFFPLFTLRSENWEGISLLRVLT